MTLHRWRFTIAANTTMRKQLTYIEPHRLGIVMGIIHGLIGAILLPVAIIKVIFDHKTDGLRASLGTWGFTLVLPVTYAIVGFVAGLVIAVIYNKIAKRLGGIEFELGDVSANGLFPPQSGLAEQPLDIHSMLIGNWLGKAANGYVGVYTYYADGNAQCEANGSGSSTKITGRWEVAGDSILAKWDNGDTDIIKLTSPKQYRWTNSQTPDPGGIATRQ